ncbi:zinc finger protein [Sesbania bispinosa]|nr:zinc finger protein [Sesbania bispinosa]
MKEKEEDIKSSEQDQVSNSHMVLDFVKLPTDDSVPSGSKLQELDFFSPENKGSSSCWANRCNNNNEGKDENREEKTNLSNTRPFHGSYNWSLGVRMESMIHKPSYSNSPLGHGHGVMWPSILNPSSHHRLRIEGGGILGASSTSRIENDHDGRTIRAILQLGESSANAATRSNLAINKPNIAPKGDHHSNNEEPSNSESCGLDLSLKL